MAVRLNLQTFRFLSFVALLSYGLGCGMPHRGALSLDELSQTVRLVHEKSDVDGLFQLYFTGDAPPELLATTRKWVQSIWAAGAVVTELKTIPYEEYHPEVKLPGDYQGRRLKWAATPSHWIILKAQLPKKVTDSQTQSIGAELPVGKMNDRWYVIGATYAD